DQIAIVPLRDVLARPSTSSGRAVSDPAVVSREPVERSNHELDRSATLFDYLARAKSSRIIVSERDEVEANATKLLEQTMTSYKAPAGRNERPLPPAELMADCDLVESRLAHATHLAQLGLDDDAAVRDQSPIPNPPSLPAKPIRCQPVAEYRGRFKDWVTEIRRLRDAGEATLFVAATPGRAERTIELLKEYEVFAIPVERAEDARYAAVLVAVGGLSRGFRLPDAGLQLFAEADVFEE